MPASRDFADHAADLLSVLGPVKVRAMFGGFSLSIDGLAFALVADDVLYLKTDDHNRPAFQTAGLLPFAPFPDEPHKTISYYPAPDGALDDRDALFRWAHPALDAARRAASRKKTRKQAIPPR